MITKADAYLKQCAAGMPAAGAITHGKSGNAAITVCDAVKVPDFIAGVWHAMN